MENLLVTIKKSKNVHAWSNQFVGEKIQVIANAGVDYNDKGYKVEFGNCRNAKVMTLANRYLTGILHFEDATKEPAQFRKFYANPQPAI